MSQKVRKPILRIFVSLSAFLLLLIIIVVIAVAFYRPKYAEPDTSGWQTGMVFFSVGDSWESVAVRSITGLRNAALADSTPSHCGIVMIGDSSLLLVHASTTAGRVVAETPAEYIENNGSYCLYVKPQPFKLDTLKLKSDIDSLLRIPVAFDFEFNHFDSKSLYCSEFVVALHELNGCNLLSRLRDKHYIYPQDILDILDAFNMEDQCLPPDHIHNPRYKPLGNFKTRE